MKPKTTAAIVGGLAGSALIVGMRLAVPASAVEYPAGEPQATPSMPPSPVACCPTSPPVTLPPTVAPTPTTGICKTVTGDPVKIAKPGIGAVTVALSFCDGVLVTAASSQTQSNWRANPQALKAMDTLAVKYHATDISMIHFSGATLTSKAYQASLKSALAKANQ